MIDLTRIKQNAHHNESFQYELQVAVNLASKVSTRARNSQLISILTTTERFICITTY